MKEIIKKVDDEQLLKIQRQVTKEIKKRKMNIKFCEHKNLKLDTSFFSTDTVKTLVYLCKNCDKQFNIAEICDFEEYKKWNKENENKKEGISKKLIATHIFDSYSIGLAHKILDETSKEYIKDFKLQMNLSIFKTGEIERVFLRNNMTGKIT